MERKYNNHYCQHVRWLQEQWNILTKEIYQSKEAEMPLNAPNSDSPTASEAAVVAATGPLDFDQTADEVVETVDFDYITEAA